MYAMCHRRLHRPLCCLLNLQSLAGERLFTVISLADLLYEAVGDARGATTSRHMELYDANA